MHDTARTGNYLIQKVNGAEDENPCLLVFYKITNYHKLVQTTTDSVA